MPKPSPEPILTGGVRAAAEALVSPTSPLERDPNSPKGWKKRQSDGVGLGIVAALSSDDKAALRHVVNFHFHRALSPPVPIAPAHATATAARSKWSGEGCATRGRCCWRVWPVEYSTGSGGSSTLFCASPPRVPDGYAHFPATGFLTACYLCRKRLDGEDIYMYRGEKAFCSTECRHRQIVADEYQDSCGHEASRPADVSDSVHSGGRLFYTSIVAA